MPTGVGRQFFGGDSADVALLFARRRVGGVTWSQSHWSSRGWLVVGRWICQCCSSGDISSWQSENSCGQPTTGCHKLCIACSSWNMLYGHPKDT